MNIKNFAAIMTLMLTACGRVGIEGTALDAINSIQSSFGLGRSVAMSQTTLSEPTSTEMFALERDSHSGAVSKIYFATDTVQAFTNDNLSSQALKWILDHADELGVQAIEISPTPIIKNLNDSKISLSFERVINDKPVRDALIEIVFAKINTQEVKMFELINRSYGGSKIIDTNNNITSSFITALENRYQAKVLDQIDLYFPQQDANGKIDLVRAVEVKLKNDNNVLTTITVAKINSETLETYTSVVAETAPLSAMLYDRSYQDSAKVSKSIPNVTVQDSNHTIVTDWLGRGDFSQNGSESITFVSPQFKVQSTPAAAIASNGILSLDNPNDARSANAYVALHRVHQFARKYYTDIDTSYFSTQVTVNTNTPGTCNAFYQPGENSINLFSAGGGCANMALVNDVMFHEWGHGLDNYTGKTPGITDGSFSEGIGDIVSSYLTGSSNLGQGFFTTKSTGIRQVNNTNKYPRDLIGEVHNDGLIIGGTFWDLRKAMIERYGDVQGKAYAEYLFFRHLITADTYKESYNIVLQLDNDDGDSTKRSPNFCLINGVFSHHGLAKEVANCQDTYDQSTTALAVETKITKAELGSYGITLKTAANLVVICQGKKIDCLKSRKDAFAMQLDGKDSNSSDSIFIGKIAQLPVNQTLNILGWDKKGQFVGISSFKMMKR